MRRQSKWKGMKNSNGLVYVGIDVHEKESQLAVLEKEGSLLLEERIPTKDLGKFLSSLPGEKRVAIESAASSIQFTRCCPPSRIAQSP
jgi:hypothetical protein